LIIEYIEKYTIGKFVKSLFAIYVLGLMILGLFYLRQTRYLVSFNYINQVPLAINKTLPYKSTIALTEAGRMAYWNQSGNHKIIDLVGLNTEYPAKNTISIRYLEELSPDMMMYHQAGQLDTEWLKSYSDNAVLLKNKDKQYFINKQKYSDSKRATMSKVENASIIATQYLQRYFDQYDIFVVDYNENKSFSHVYAFKKTLLLTEKVHTILKESFQKNTALSYYEMVNKLESENLNSL
jgi:hypothetical protein